MFYGPNHGYGYSSGRNDSRRPSSSQHPVADFIRQHLVYVHVIYLIIFICLWLDRRLGVLALILGLALIYFQAMRSHGYTFKRQNSGRVDVTGSATSSFDKGLRVLAIISSIICLIGFFLPKFVRYPSNISSTAMLLGVSLPNTSLNSFLSDFGRSALTMSELIGNQHMDLMIGLMDVVQISLICIPFILIVLNASRLGKSFKWILSLYYLVAVVLLGYGIFKLMVKEGLGTSIFSLIGPSAYLLLIGAVVQLLCPVIEWMQLKR